eukprot:g1787.t1
MSGQSNDLNWWNKDAVAGEASAPSSGNGIGNANNRQERNDNEPERRQRDGGGGWDDWKNYNGKWEKDAAGYWRKVDGDGAGASANERPEDANGDGGWDGNWGNGNGGRYGNRYDDYTKDKKDRAWPENGLSDAENAYARSLTRTLRHAKEGGK